MPSPIGTPAVPNPLDIISIQVQWNDTTTVTYSSNTAASKLVQVDTISMDIREDGIATVQNFGFTIQDFDKSVLTLANTNVLNKCNVVATRTIDTVAKVIFSGTLNDNITWDESTYSLKLTADSTYVKGKDIGVVLVEDDFDLMRGDAIGQMVPMPFGCPHKYKALQVTGDINGTTETELNENSTELTVSGGTNFPQDESLKVLVNRVCCTGSFSGDIFTISEVNSFLYSKNDASPIAFDARPIDDPTFTMSAYIVDGEKYILDGMFFLVSKVVVVNSVPVTKYALNRCVKQYNNICYFQKPFAFEDSPGATFAVDNTYIIEEVAGLPREVWGYDYIIDVITKDTERWGTQTYSFEDWIIAPGANVRLPVRGSSYAISSRTATLLGVYAYRTVNDEKVLVPVPSSYFTQSTETVQGVTIKTLEFVKSLLERGGEEWDSDLYVTVSTAATTPLLAITALLTDYSDCTVTSDTDVAALMTNRRSNFCLHETGNVFNICAAIAYQSMLSLQLAGTVVTVSTRRKTTATSLMTFDDTNVVLKTTQLVYPSISNGLTKIIAAWKPTETDTEHIITYVRNEAKFNAKTSNLDITIFDVKPLVEQTVYFYGYRLTDIWRQVSLSSAIDALGLIPFDVSTLDMEDLLGLIKGVVYATTYNDTIDCVIELACAVGANVEDANYWLGDPGITYTGYTGKYPYESAQLLDYVITIDSDGNGGKTSESDGEETPAYSVKVQNISSLAFVDEYSICRTTGTKDGDAPSDGKYGVGLADTPLAAEPFIFVKKCGVGALADAVTAGACPCKINVASTSHKYAKAIDGDPTKLVSAETGFGRILWTAGTNTGEQWAVVQLWGGGGGSSAPAKFCFSIQELACPKAEVDGQLVDIPPAAGEDVVTSLCNGGDGRWLRINVADTACTRNASFDNSYSAKFGMPVNDMAEGAEFSFTPHHTGCAIHELQTSYYLWEDTLDQWEIDINNWILNGCQGTEPALPTFSNLDAAKLVTAILARDTHPSLEELENAHIGWGDTFKLSYYMGLYSTWYTTKQAPFIAAYGIWDAAWQSWFNGGQTGPEPAFSLTLEAMPPYSGTFLDEDFETWFTAINAYSIAYNTWLSNLDTWDHASYPPVFPTPVAPIVITLITDADLIPLPDYDHTGDGTWLMGQWLGIVKFEADNSVGKGAMTIVAADCSTGIMEDESVCYGWNTISWISCTDCNGAGAGWYCIKVSESVYAPTYYLAEPALHYGGPYATEELALAAGCACVGNLTEERAQIIELDLAMSEYNCNGVQIPGLSLAVKMKFLFKGSLSTVLTYSCEYTETFSGTIGTAETIINYERASPNCTNGMTGANWPLDGIQLTCSAPNYAFIVSFVVRTPNASSGTTYWNFYGLGWGTGGFLPAGTHTMYTSAGSLCSQIGQQVVGTCKVTETTCTRIAGSYTYQAVYSCETLSYTVTKIASDPDSGTVEDTGWIDQGFGTYTRTNMDPCLPDPPTEEPDCYWDHQVVYTCNSSSSGSFGTIQTQLIGPYGYGSPEWQEYVQDACTFVYYCTTTSATPPALPPEPNCSACV